MKLEPHWKPTLPQCPLNESFYLTKPLFLNGHSYDTFGEVVRTHKGAELETKGFGYCFSSLPRLLEGVITSEILQFANRVLMAPLDHRSAEWVELITNLVVPDSIQWVQVGPNVELLAFK